jgi:hypothetical protein
MAMVSRVSCLLPVIYCLPKMSPGMCSLPILLTAKYLARVVGANLNSSPVTYQLDGRQFVLTLARSVIYAWSLPGACGAVLLPANNCSPQQCLKLNSCDLTGNDEIVWVC